MSPSGTRSLTVYVVDDDTSIRDSLSLMLGLSGYSTRLFADAESFLSAWQPDWSGCVVADLRLPRMSGVELQAWVRTQGSASPFVIITGHGDVPAARAAFLAQAVDFLEKPFDDAQLRKAIDSAFEMEQQRSDLASATHVRAEKLQRLTGRERQVLQHVVRGLHAKEIAAALRISARTVEVHKMHIMEKLEVRNVAELVRFTVSADDPNDAGQA